MIESPADELPIRAGARCRACRAESRARDIALAFDLGDGARLTGRVERGEQGQVEELVTSRGAFAVKTTFGAPELDGEDAAFQAAARAAGVPTPEVRADCAGWMVRQHRRPVGPSVRMGRTATAGQ